ncbi:MAG: hypothetical protein WBM62_05235, partial [Crocosphaera sp.]
PFWVDGQGWTPAESLKQDDILLNKAGEKLSLDRIEIRLERSHQLKKPYTIIEKMVVINM